MKRKPSILDFSPALDLADRRINVDADSRRIAVRVARFGEVHSGFGADVRVPRNVNVNAAHVGNATLDSGETIRVATLPMDTVHAPKDLAAMHAAAWYENTGTQVARGRYSIDDEGVRFDGLLFDDVDDAKLDRVLAASASGDWRAAVALKSFSDFEHTPADFIGSCIVNIPGFSDTFANRGAGMRLAASAHTILSIEEGTTVEDETTPAADEAALTAGAGDSNPDGAADLAPGCSGECTGCTCGGAPVEEAPETVTITASALKRLLDLSTADAGITPEEQQEAVDEAMTALVAGGFVAAPDPMAERLARIEQTVIDLAFGQD